jgi:hypothetical protein
VTSGGEHHITPFEHVKGHAARQARHSRWNMTEASPKLKVPLKSSSVSSQSLLASSWSRNKQILIHPYVANVISVSILTISWVLETCAHRSMIEFQQ